MTIDVWFQPHPKPRYTPKIGSSLVHSRMLDYPGTRPPHPTPTLSGDYAMVSPLVQSSVTRCTYAFSQQVGCYALRRPRRAAWDQRLPVARSLQGATPLCGDLAYSAISDANRRACIYVYRLGTRLLI